MNAFSRRGMFCLLLASAGVAIPTFAAPPIEALQRSVQQRWGAITGGLHRTFPPRSDGQPAPSYPESFYGADLDNPTQLNILLNDLESAVFDTLATKYLAIDPGSYFGSASYNDVVNNVAFGGNFFWSPPGVRYLAAYYVRPPVGTPTDNRVSALEELIGRCQSTVTWFFAPYQFTATLKSANASNYTSLVCGSANDQIPAAWAAAPWVNQGGWTIYTANCAGANVSTGIHGGVIDAPHSDSNANAYSTRVSWNVGDSPGSIIFCAQASGSSDAGLNADCPVNPNGLWGVLEQKGADGLTVSKWIGHGPDNDTPPPGINTCGGAGWGIYIVGGVFTGSFNDDWSNEGCPSCGQENRCPKSEVKSLDWSIGFGSSNFGKKQVVVSLHSDDASKRLCSPSSLSFQIYTTDTLIRDATTGTPLQLVTPTTVVNFSVESDHKFHLLEYPRSAAGSTVQGDGTLPVSGDPTRDAVVENLVNGGVVNWNAVQITVLSGASATSDVSLYTYDHATSIWTLTRPNVYLRAVLTPTWNAGHTDRTDRREVFDAQSNVLSRVDETYHVFGWGRSLVKRVVDPGGAALTTVWNYYTADAAGAKRTSRAQSRVDPNGYWETYDYDAYGREAKRVCQVGNSGVGSPDASNRVVVTVYATTNPAMTQVETTLNVETARRYRAYFLNEARDIVCTVPGAQWNAASNLVTVTKTVSGGPFNGDVMSVLRPDGTFTAYTYTLSTSPTGTSIKTTTIASGQPDSLSSPTTVVDGTLTTTVVDGGGNQLLNTVQAIVPGGGSILSMSSATTQSTDGFGRPTVVAFEDGTTQLTSFGCCGPDSMTDRNSVTTTYTYNWPSQVATETRGGVQMMYSYDAMGRRVTTQRAGSDSSVITLESKTFDLAGRLISSADGLGRTTTFAESFAIDGKLIRTTTFASGTADAASRIETYNQDGTLFSVAGAAAHPLSYDYGADFSGKSTKETRVGDGGVTTEWTMNYTDMAGRNSKTLMSSGAQTLRVFSSTGLNQLQYLQDPDGVVTLYAYNGRGETQDTAVSATGGTTISYGGSDQITRVARTFATHSGGPAVVRETTSVWTQNGNATPTVMRVVDRTLNGRMTWMTDFPQTGQSLTTATVESVTGGILSRSTTNPDGTSMTEQSSSGRTIGQTRFDSTGGVIGSQTFSYDPHGRLAAVTPSRIGATTYTYTGADETQTVSAAGETMSYTYDFRGRKIKDTLPDLAEVNYAYFPTGELASMSGARTYPQSFTYDAQGRTKTLVTSGSAGNATTTWNYDPQSGFLSSKIYQDGKGMSYSSTLAGRPKTRAWARGVVTTYTPDPAGRITTISYAGGIATPTVNITYDRRSRGTVFDRGTDGVQNIVLGDDGFWLGESVAGGALAGVTVQAGPNTLRQRSGLSVAVGETTAVAQSFDYDSAGRLFHAGYGGTIQATYGYLPNSFVDLVSSIDFAAGGSSAMTTVKSYDANRDRLAGVASTTGASAAASYGYHYNLAGQRDMAMLADGGRWDYGYDLLGQVTSGSRKFSDGTPAQGQQFGYSFDSIGNRTQTITNGRSAPYTNNLLNQIVTRSVPQVVDVSGRASPQATVTVNDQPTVRQDNGYFSAAVSVPDRGADATPVTVTINAVIPGPSPSGSNVVSSQAGVIPLSRHPETFTYDFDGNLLSDGIWNYAWDAENRLVQMTSYLPVGNPVPKTQLDFKYDAFGRRISKVTTPRGGAVVTSKFVYDGWNLVAELDQTNALVRSYLWGTDLSGSPQGAGGVGGLLAVRNVSPTVTDNLVANDGNGNVAALVDASTGTISATYEYGPFGELIRATGAMAAANPIRWSSKYQDLESGFSYYGYRFYDPRTGRWMSRDILLEAGSINLYKSVSNNPLSRIDILGSYDIDVHFYVTYLTAVASGFSTSQAYRLAYYAQLPDQDWWLTAYANEGKVYDDFTNFGATLRLKNLYETLHSLHGGDAEARRKCLQKLLSDGSLTNDWQRGFVIHALGDSYSHTYIPTGGGPAIAFKFPKGHYVKSMPLQGREYDMVAYRPALAQEYANGLQNTLARISPDPGAANPALFDAMTKEMMSLPMDSAGAITQMKDFARRNGYEQPFEPTHNFNTDEDMDRPSNPEIDKLLELIKCCGKR